MAESTQMLLSVYVVPGHGTQNGWAIKNRRAGKPGTLHELSEQGQTHTNSLELLSVGEKYFKLLKYILCFFYYWKWSFVSQNIC